MNELMLDTDGSRSGIMQEAFDVKIPATTKSYQPVANEKFVSLLHTTADMMGLELSNPTIGLAKEGQQVFGTFDVEGQNHVGDMVKLMLGWRNSYDKSLAAGVCFGSRVFVCSNLMFTGYAGEDNEIFGTVFHKHTVNVDRVFPERVKVALGQFEKFRQFQDGFYTRLQDTMVGDYWAYGAVVKAVMADVIPNANVKKVVNEWHYQQERPDVIADDRPWHPEFQERNAFSLMNAFTEVAKEYQEKNPVVSSARDIATSKFFHDEFIRKNCNTEEYAI